MARHAEVVARWVVRRRRARPQSCVDCGTPFDGVACPGCGALAPMVGVPAMALVVELAGGRRVLVVAERDGGGRWVAVADEGGDCRGGGGVAASAPRRAAGRAVRECGMSRRLGEPRGSR